jgi:hypothetical protein
MRFERKLISFMQLIKDIRKGLLLEIEELASLPTSDRLPYYSDECRVHHRMYFTPRTTEALLNAVEPVCEPDTPTLTEPTGRRHAPRAFLPRAYAAFPPVPKFTVEFSNPGSVASGSESTDSEQGDSCKKRRES